MLGLLPKRAWRQSLSRRRSASATPAGAWYSGNTTPHSAGRRLAMSDAAISTPVFVDAAVGWPAPLLGTRHMSSRDSALAGQRRLLSSAAMMVRDDTGHHDDSIVPFVLTDIGEGIMEVELLQWFVQPGDHVKQFDKVCEVQSDKATVEISSRYDGQVMRLHYNAGDMIKTGSVLVDIMPEGKMDVMATASRHGPRLSIPPAPRLPQYHPAAPAAAAAFFAPEAAAAAPLPDEEMTAEAAGGDMAVMGAMEEEAATAATTAGAGSAGPAELVLTTPAVRRLAREHRIDLSGVRSTGPKSRLLKADLLRHIAERGLAAPPAPVLQPPTLHFPARAPAPAPVTVTPVAAAAATAAMAAAGAHAPAGGAGRPSAIPSHLPSPPPLVPKHRTSTAPPDFAFAAAAAATTVAADGVRNGRVAAGNGNGAPFLSFAAGAAGAGGGAGIAQPQALRPSMPFPHHPPPPPRMQHMQPPLQQQQQPQQSPTEPMMISGRWSEAHVPTPGQTVPIRGIQRSMLEAMKRSLEVPHMVYCDEVVMDKTVVLRNDLKGAAAERGVKLSYLPLVIKATSLALKRFPLLNSSLSPCQTAITYHKDHNIGVAMDTPRGLLVPNIKAVQDKNIFDIAAELNRLQRLGTEGKLGEADLLGGTFSLSNIGSIGGTYASPVILHPQVAIGALGKMKRVPRFNDEGNVVGQTILLISWSGDHRIIDGGTMARFSNLWKSFLENPAAMLGEAR